jgi:cell division protein FtsI/penicillin-binding protein 2
LTGFPAVFSINIKQVRGNMWRYKNMKFFFPSILALFLFCNGCGRGHSGPEQVAATFLENWHEQKYEAMYETLTAEACANYDQDHFINRYQNIERGIGLTGLDYAIVGGKPENEKRHMVYFTVNLHTGTVGDIPVDNTMLLVREAPGGPWKIAWEPSLIFPELTGNRTVELQRLEPERGLILDRFKRPLVAYRNFKQVGVVPGRYDDRSSLVQKISALLDLTPEQINKALDQPWVAEGMFVPLTVLEPDKEHLANELLAISGVMIDHIRRRYYPGGADTAHLVGYLSEISDEELAEKRSEGYYVGDLTGRHGVEAVADARLTGSFGFQIQIIEGDGTAASLIANKEKKDGEDVVLTIDLDLQAAAAEALGEKTGAVVALEPNSGEVLALVSKPAFDPNWFMTGISAAQWQTLMEDPRRPLTNRALNGLSPPGSVIKPVTAAAALEEGILNPEERVAITGKRWQPSPSWGGYHIERARDEFEWVNLFEAMIYSDNIYFARLGLSLGEEKFTFHARRFGFEQEIPFPLPVSPSCIAKNGIDREPLLADSAYGQGEVLMTPFHLALVYCAFANGGTVPVPRLFLETESEKEPWLDDIISRETVDTINRALVETVHADEAPAADGRVRGITVAGKTGTAQLDHRTDNICWYVTYAPAENPEIVVAVMVEGGTWARQEALPVARRVLEAYFQIEN